MLALMKSLMNSFVGKIVVMIIIAGMAFWGVDQMFAQICGGLGSNMAAAGSRGFDAAAFDRRVESVVRNINADSEEPVTKPDLVEQGIIDQIFNMEAAKLTLLGYADSIGVRPSTDAVVEELRNTDAFKNPLTGSLDLDTYRLVLNQNRISYRQITSSSSPTISRWLPCAMLPALRSIRPTRWRRFRGGIWASPATWPGSS